MQLGADKLIALKKDEITKGGLGLLAHQASIASSKKHLLDVFKEEGVVLSTLFGPEHGFLTEAQDMESVKDGRLRVQDASIPVYSLYGDSFESLKPTPEMFEGLKCLVVDLQDVGTRYYTYVYTMAFCMQAAAQTGTKVIVCDRPNPINGADIEGALIEPGLESFVGLYPLPNRHGMTVGELAQFFNQEHNIGCDLEIITMDGWKREQYWDDTGLTWANPSPNMRSLRAATLYPGMCLLEGTNVSEGRGTEAPFEACGAPFIDKKELAKNLNAMKLPGIKFHPVSFTPNRQKWQDRECHGVMFEVKDRKKFRPYLTGLGVICALSAFEGFEWRTEEYEFRSDVPAVDLLTGTSKVREAIDAKVPFEEFSPKFTQTPEEFLATRQKYLLY